MFLTDYQHGVVTLGAVSRLSAAKDLVSLLYSRTEQKVPFCFLKTRIKYEFAFLTNKSIVDPCVSDVEFKLHQSSFQRVIRECILVAAALLILGVFMILST